MVTICFKKAVLLLLLCSTSVLAKEGTAGFLMGGYSEILSFSYNSDDTTNMDLSNSSACTGLELSYKYAYLKYIYGFGGLHQINAEVTNDTLLLSVMAKKVNGTTRHKSEYDDSGSHWLDEYDGEELESLDQKYLEVKLGYIFTGEFWILKPFSYRAVTFQNRQQSEGWKVALTPSVVLVYSNFATDELFIPDAEQESYPDNSGSYRGNDFYSFGSTIDFTISQFHKNYFGGISLELPLAYYSEGEILYESGNKQVDNSAGRSIDLSIFLGYTGSYYYWKINYSQFGSDSYTIDKDDEVSVSKTHLCLLFKGGISF